MIHEFVELIPDDLKEGVVYISMTFGTVVHKCCCGCGGEVVTPLSPTDWKLTFDGESISLYPSIGNWSFNCKSHYWITNNKVEWARKWSEKEIKAERHKDFLEKRKYYHNKEQAFNSDFIVSLEKLKNNKLEIRNKFWSKIKKWWF